MSETARPAGTPDCLREEDLRAARTLVRRDIEQVILHARAHGASEAQALMAILMVACENVALATSRPAESEANAQQLLSRTFTRVRIARERAADA